MCLQILVRLIFISRSKDYHLLENVIRLHLPYIISTKLVFFCFSIILLCFYEWLCILEVICIQNWRREKNKLAYNDLVFFVSSNSYKATGKDKKLIFGIKYNLYGGWCVSRWYMFAIIFLIRSYKNTFLARCMHRHYDMEIN